MVQTVYEVTRAGARHAPAIGAPGRPWLDYAGLKTLVDATVAQLNGAGIGRGDRVALVLPNGPEMAAAFIAVAACATAVPLDPDGSGEALAELEPRSVIVLRGADHPASGIPVIELAPQAGGAAGLFTLDVSRLPPGKAKPGPSRGPDIALVLRAGTRIVPLTVSNLAASARHIGAALALTPRDRCLNIMPLASIHGLVASVLSSLAAGASVACAPGFDAAGFLGLLNESKATWFTAEPALHQAILAEIALDPRGRTGDAHSANLRFVRSSSTALAPQIMSALEEAFGCPVIESYGMTEAAHQMASNALPPGRRKPGSVGLHAGPKIAIMDADGKILPRGQTGEIVVQGPNVTLGYEGDPDANQRAFTEEWFRTGDQGRFDEDGYLFVTGRV